MIYRRATLMGLAMLGGSLIAVELTASAMQMAAIHAESKRVAMWRAEQQHLAAVPAPVRASNIVEASLR